jgi:drug/metabolite transporter (DMT)-like permease
LTARAGREALAPAAVNLFKNVLAGSLFALYACIFGARLPELDVWPALLVSGVFGFTLADTLHFAALPRAGVQAAALIEQLNVPAAALFAFVMFGERLASTSFFAIALVLLGVALVVLDAHGEHAEQRSRTLVRLGVACALAAALAQALAIVIGHHGLQDVDLLGGTLVRMLGGISGALLLALAWDGVRRVRGRSPVEFVRLFEPFRRKSDWKRLAFASLFASVLGLPLFHYGLRELPSGLSSVLFATTPLFTLPLGLLFGKHHGWKAWVGTAVGYLGVAWIVRDLAQQA